MMGASMIYIYIYGMDGGKFEKLPKFQPAGGRRAGWKEEKCGRMRVAGYMNRWMIASSSVVSGEGRKELIERRYLLMIDDDYIAVSVDDGR